MWAQPVLGGSDASVSLSSVPVASIMIQVNLVICVKSREHLAKLNFTNKQLENNSGLPRLASLLCCRLLSQSCQVACEQFSRRLGTWAPTEV